MDIKLDINLQSNLNKTVVCSKFEYKVCFVNGFLYLEFEYFGDTIIVQQVVTDPAKAYNGYKWRCSKLIIKRDNHNTITVETSCQKSIVKSRKQILQRITQHLRSRPFIILKYGRGMYRLLDPNGMDYIGEYVTLYDAKKTCKRNFIFDQ